MAIRCLLALGVALTSGSVAAQTAQIERPGDERPELPSFAAPTTGDGFVLPPLAPPAAADAPLSEQLRVYVRSVRVAGNTVFAPERIQQVVASYVGREVTSEELQQLRYELTLLYVNAGYINSGVIIPDQQVKDGEIVLQVVEGELTRIDVGDGGSLNPEYIRGRVALGADKPLNINSLRESLQLLQQDPLVRRIDSRLEPGDRPGESVLSVNVEEKSPYVFGLSLNNHRSPSIGSYQADVTAAHRNLTGWGDTLGLRYSMTEGLDDIELSYRYPLTARGLTLELDAQRSDSEVVEEPFNDIDVESESSDYSLGLHYPLRRSLNRSFDFSARLERRKSETFLLGRPFSFSDGVDDGVSRVTVLRLIADWVDRRENQVLAFRSTFSVGLDAFGATINKGTLDGEPDGQFFAWLGQFQYARRFGENNNQLIVRADMQLSRDPLLPLEQFAVGGASTVRGYRENQLVRDNGVIGSVELRMPVLHDEAGQSTTQLVVFTDIGRAWNEDRATPEPSYISSAGLGLRWDPTPQWHAELYGAVPFRNVDGGDEHDLQDSGIHFLLNYQY